MPCRWIVLFHVNMHFEGIIKPSPFPWFSNCLALTGSLTFVGQVAGLYTGQDLGMQGRDRAEGVVSVSEKTLRHCLREEGKGWEPWSAPCEYFLEVCFGLYLFIPVYLITERR